MIFRLSREVQNQWDTVFRIYARSRMAAKYQFKKYMKQSQCRQRMADGILSTGLDEEKSCY
jgi:hypothetical protein